jgi:hypothetical protein
MKAGLGKGGPRFPSSGGSLAEGAAAAAIIGKAGQIADEFKQIHDHIRGNDQRINDNRTFRPGDVRTGGGRQRTPEQQRWFDRMLRGENVGAYPESINDGGSPLPPPQRPIIPPQQRIDEVKNALEDAAKTSTRQGNNRGFIVDSDGDVIMGPSRGVLMPFEHDWTAEADELRNWQTPRQRAGQIAMIGIGGETAREAYTTWRERAKWMAKNSGTPYEAKMPVTIPTDAPGDLDPGMKPPDLPVFPSKPNPIVPQQRTSSNWIMPVNTSNRVSVVGHKDEVNCKC